MTDYISINLRLKGLLKHCSYLLQIQTVMETLIQLSIQKKEEEKNRKLYWTLLDAVTDWHAPHACLCEHCVIHLFDMENRAHWITVNLIYGVMPHLTSHSVCLLLCSSNPPVQMNSLELSLLLQCPLIGFLGIIESKHWGFSWNP